jgi:hypothetical protein
MKDLSYFYLFLFELGFLFKKDLSYFYSFIFELGFLQVI